MRKAEVSPEESPMLAGTRGRKARALPAPAQDGSAAGRLTDAGGTPVPEALVSLDPGGWRTRSSGQGEYIIARVPAGTYTMRVRIPASVAPAAQVTIPDGQSARQDVSLGRVAVSLSDVVIGSRARHTAAD